MKAFSKIKFHVQKFMNVNHKLEFEFKFEFVNDGRVLNAKDNNVSKSWNLHFQSTNGVTADAWKYAI